MISASVKYDNKILYVMHETPETGSFSVSDEQDRNAAVYNEVEMPVSEKRKQYGKHFNTDHNICRTQ